MGIVDKRVYSVSCLRCNKNETVKVVDKGSRWGGSAWTTNRAKFKEFEVAWNEESESIEPTLKSATCNTCGLAATVSSQYST